MVSLNLASFILYDIQRGKLQLLLMLLLLLLLQSHSEPDQNDCTCTQDTKKPSVETLLEPIFSYTKHVCLLLVSVDGESCTVTIQHPTWLCKSVGGQTRELSTIRITDKTSLWLQWKNEIGLKYLKCSSFSWELLEPLKDPWYWRVGEIHIYIYIYAVKK